MNKTHFIDYTIFITLHYVHGWKGLLFRVFQLFHRDSGKASGADKSAPTGYLDGFVERLHLSIIENNGE
jgi:hypothetical protein